MQSFHSHRHRGRHGDVARERCGHRAANGINNSGNNCRLGRVSLMLWRYTANSCRIPLFPVVASSNGSSWTSRGHVGPHAQRRSSEDLLDRAVSLIFQNSWPNSSSAHAAEHRRHRCYLKIADNCSQRPTNATALQLQPFNRCTLANTIVL